MHDTFTLTCIYTVKATEGVFIHFCRQRIMVNLLTTALELLKERSNKKQMKRGRSEKQSITEKVYRDINCNLTL